jgi:hypothetical protein
MVSLPHLRKERQLMQWKHDGSPRPKKFQTASSAGKWLATVFWDMEGILMVVWLPQGTTVNSVVYCSIIMSSSSSLTATTCTVVSVSWCILSRKTGVLHPSGSYQKDGNGTLTSVEWSVLKCDCAAVIISVCIPGGSR